MYSLFLRYIKVPDYLQPPNHGFARNRSFVAKDKGLTQTNVPSTFQRNKSLNKSRNSFEKSESKTSNESSNNKRKIKIDQPRGELKSIYPIF